MATGPLPSSGFSSRSAVETSSRGRSKGVSVVQQSSYQSSQTQSRSRRSRSLCQADQEAFPVPALPQQEKHSYTFTAPPPPGSLRRSLSGTLAQDRGGAMWVEEELPNQYTYRGPSHRTISRITNRQQQQQHFLQGSSLSPDGWTGSVRGVPTAGDGWRTQWQQHVSRANHVMGGGQYQVPVHRAASLRSIRSVGKGVDILDGASIHSNDPLEGWDTLHYTHTSTVH